MEVIDNDLFYFFFYGIQHQNFMNFNITTSSLNMWLSTPRSLSTSTSAVHGYNTKYSYSADYNTMKYNTIEIEVLYEYTSISVEIGL